MSGSGLGLTLISLPQRKGLNSPHNSSLTASIQPHLEDMIQKDSIREGKVCIEHVIF